MDRELAITEIRSAFPTEIAEQLTLLLRPSIRLKAKQASGVPEGSRFGGQVQLPKGVTWPEWDPTAHYAPLIQSTEEEVRKVKEVQLRLRENDPRRYAHQERWLENARRMVARGKRRMNFLMRICLRDFTGFASGIELPSDGVLSIFYDVDVKPGGWTWSLDGWRVIYSSGHDEVNHGRDKNAAWGEKCLAMEFEEAWTLATNCQRAGSALELDEEYDFLGERLRGEWGEMHHVGGWADEIQGDPGPPQAMRVDSEWVLLLQLASDDPRCSQGLGWMWGDGGTLYFWIRREDLASRDFSRVWCGYQTC